MVGVGAGVGQHLGGAPQRRVGLAAAAAAGGRTRHAPECRARTPRGSQAQRALEAERPVAAITAEQVVAAGAGQQHRNAARARAFGDHAAR